MLTRAKIRSPWSAALLAILAGLLFYSGSDTTTHLQQVSDRGSVIVITRNSPTSYYIGPDGPTGMEYDLARLFAERLGVELEVVLADSFDQIFELLESGQGDFIAANLTPTLARKAAFRFGPAYEEVETTAVYRRGTRRPQSLADLVGRRVAVIRGSSYERILRQARSTLPALQWEAQDTSIEDLLAAVNDGELDATLVDSNVLKIHRRFFPRVKEAFNLAQSDSLHWLFPGGDDDSLAQQARRFFHQVASDGRLAALKQRYYDYVENFDQIGLYNFAAQARARLPELIPHFKTVGEIYDLDWRLLAAVGYQESHWDPEAVSRTGVRGIMMLTQQTARQLGVEDRLDPEQSIEGGARYLRELIEKVPERIPMPDRLWLALAAYNLGFGHLEDARRLTQAEGGDPDRWSDVREYVRLLSKPQWYQRTRYGYARGFEAVRYVSNVRSFYDILVWMDNQPLPLWREGDIQT